MNTGEGFKSYFAEIFGTLQKLYIIKGGPGTGKSRFMSEVALFAESKGLSVTRYLCSSDPSSLDGIIITELSLGIIDGTAPHSYEPILVGAKDNIIDLGRFWSIKTLEKEISLIKDISLGKSRLYSEIYSYLNAVLSIDKVISGTVCSAVKTEKLGSTAKKYASMLTKGSVYEKKLNLRSAISDSGFITLNTFSKISDKRYAVIDTCGVGGIFLTALLEETDKNGISATVSFSPFSPTIPDAIYYPDSGISFYLGNEKDFIEENITTRRFIDEKLLKAYKPKLRSLKRIRKDILSEVNLNFSSIKRLHLSLEEIYGAAMDFNAKEMFTKEFIASLFG